MHNRQTLATNRVGIQARVGHEHAGETFLRDVARIVAREAGEEAVQRNVPGLAEHQGVDDSAFHEVLRKIEIKREWRVGAIERPESFERLDELLAARSQRV